MLASGLEELEVESVSESTAKSETPSYKSPTYDELLELITRAMTRLSLEWSGPKHEDTRGQLNKRYLPGHKSPAPLSLPYTKVAGSWSTHLYSACIVPLNLLNIEWSMSQSPEAVARLCTYRSGPPLHQTGGPYNRPIRCRYGGGVELGLSCITMFRAFLLVSLEFDDVFKGALFIRSSTPRDVIALRWPMILAWSYTSFRHWVLCGRIPIASATVSFPSPGYTRNPKRFLHDKTQLHLDVN